jgi:hypothetical protein
MSRPKPTPAPKKKASGQNVEEWQRSGCKVQFRLSETYADALIRLAAKEGLPPNIVASRIVRDALQESIPDGRVAEH